MYTSWLPKVALAAIMLSGSEVQAFSPIATPTLGLRNARLNNVASIAPRLGGRLNGVTGLSMASRMTVESWSRSGGREIMSKISHEEIEAMFKKFDSNNDGNICDADLKKALLEKGVAMTDYEFMLFLQEVDTNVDGQICVEDFEQAVLRMKNQATGAGDDKSMSRTILDGVGAGTDAWREGSRRYRRTVFGPNDWIRYRRSTRLLDNLLNSFNSSVLRALWFDISIIVSLATALLVYNHILTDGLVLNWIQQYMTAEEFEPEQIAQAAETFKNIPKLQLPLSPFTLSSPSLGLLLVFRTNGAFQRFFEARALWGSVINYSRNCAAQGARYLTTKKDIEEFCRRTIVFSRSLKLHLRYESDKEEVGRAEMERLLGKKEADRLLACAHRPCQAITDLGAFVRHAGLSPFQIQSFDKTFEQFHNQLGACERIFKTPLPLIYTRHTSRFLTIWCGMLPFALYNEVKGSPVLIPIVAVIAAFLLGIEELGVQIAEPFSVLALENMCDGIEASCKQIVAKALEADDEGGWEDRYVGDAATTTILPPGVSRDQFNYAPVEKAVTVASFGDTPAASSAAYFAAPAVAAAAAAAPAESYKPRSGGGGSYMENLESERAAARAARQEFRHQQWGGK